MQDEFDFISASVIPMYDNDLFFFLSLPFYRKGYGTRHATSTHYVQISNRTRTFCKALNCYTICSSCSISLISVKRSCYTDLIRLALLHSCLLKSNKDQTPSILFENPSTMLRHLSSLTVSLTLTAMFKQKK